jgi:hypothetical protein
MGKKRGMAVRPFRPGLLVAKIVAQFFVLTDSRACKFQDVMDRPEQEAYNQLDIMNEHDRREVPTKLGCLDQA